MAHQTKIGGKPCSCCVGARWLACKERLERLNRIRACLCALFAVAQILFGLRSCCVRAFALNGALFGVAECIRKMPSVLLWPWLLKVSSRYLFVGGWWRAFSIRHSKSSHGSPLPGRRSSMAEMEHKLPAANHGRCSFNLRSLSTRFYCSCCYDVWVCVCLCRFMGWSMQIDVLYGRGHCSFLPFQIISKAAKKTSWTFSPKSHKKKNGWRCPWKCLR